MTQPTRRYYSAQVPKPSMILLNGIATTQLVPEAQLLGEACNKPVFIPSVLQ